MKNYRWPKTYEMLIKKALKSLDKIIVFNAFEQEELESFCGSGRSIVIANGIEKIPSKDITPLECAKDQLTDKLKTILFVGAVNKLKGAEDLIQIAYEISEKKSINAQFIFAGPIHGDVKIHDIPTNTRFLGPITPNQLAGIYQQADMLVLPSYSEGMPMVILEAMANSLPVITTHVGSIPSIVEHSNSGYITTPGNIKKLKAFILELLQNPQKARQMGEFGNKIYKRNFTGKIMADAYLDLYKSVVKK